MKANERAAFRLAVVIFIGSVFLISALQMDAPISAQLRGAYDATGCVERS